MKSTPNAPETTWRSEVAKQAQRAQERLGEGDFGGASEFVSSAFAVVDERGNEEDVTFVALLVVAGDVASAAGDIESGASLYNRATGVCAALGEDSGPGPDSSDVPALLARAYLGLARADVNRGYRDRAQERYRLALGYMRSCEPTPPPALLKQIQDELSELETEAED